VAVRPDGKELYVYGSGSPIILIVDIDSPDYPVIGKIQLQGRMAGTLAETPYISFSHDSTYAYISRPILREFEGNYDYSRSSHSDFTKIIVIDTAKREIDRVISIPWPFTPTPAIAPSPDGRWLYFTAADFPAHRLGIGKLNLESQTVDVDFLPLEGVNFITLSSDGKHIYATQGSGIAQEPSLRNHFSIVDIESFQVVSSVAVGSGPRYVSVTPDGRKAYVSNLWSNDISVINLKAMKVITTIDAGLAEPREIVITSDGKKAYVVYPGTFASMARYGPGNMVAVIDVEKDVVVGKIEVHGDPQSIAIDPDGTRAYVSDGGANGVNPSEVHVIDVVNDIYLRPIILRQAAHYTPTAIDVTPDGQKLFVAGEATGNLQVINAKTGATLDELDIQPLGVKASADGARVYVFSPQELFVINSNSLEVVKSIDLIKVYPTPPPRWDSEAFRIVLNRVEDTAYLLGNSAEIIVVNLTRGEVVANIPFAEGPIHIARGLALTPDESKLFASDYYSRTVAVIDTSTNTVIARVPVANCPSEIKISQDGKRAYVLQQQDMTMMTIIDVDTHAVLRRVGFGQAIAAALDFELSWDERYAYIARFDPNFLMVYDLQEEKNAKAIDTGLDPFNVASTPDKQLIYITNFTTDDISVVDTTTNSLTKTIKLGESIE